MKKSTIKPCVLSALAALALGAVGTAGTFALFTDKAETSISIASGKIDVSTSFELFEVSSLNAGDTHTMITDSAKHNATFENGGTLAITDTGIQIAKWTPGDRAVLKMSSANASNIVIKTMIEKQVSSYLADGVTLDTSDYKLGEKLKVKVYGTSDLAGEYKLGKWQNMGVGETVQDLYIEIEFPDGDNGQILFGEDNHDNPYQDKAASIKLVLNAVQGNAQVGDAPVETLPATPVNQAVTTASNQNTSGTYDAEGVVFETTQAGLPAEQAGTKTTLNTGWITSEVPSKELNVVFTCEKKGAEAAEQADVFMVGDEEQYFASFDLNLTVNNEQVSTFNGTYVTVESNIGKDLDPRVQYNGVDLKEDGDNVTDYSYDRITGILTITTNHFSEYFVVGTYFGTSADYETEASQLVYTVSNSAELQNLLDGKGVDGTGSGIAINGATIYLEGGNYDAPEIRPTKESTADTFYTAKSFGYVGESNLENLPLDGTLEKFLAYKASTAWTESPYYTRTLQNIKFVGKGANVNMAGFQSTSGHVCAANDQPTTDYVRGITQTAGSLYYGANVLNNISFENINFTARVNLETSIPEGTISNVKFEHCSFTTGGTDESKTAAIRYYNENNNGVVNNLTVKDCKFENVRQGVYTHHVKNVTVDHCSFDRTGHNAIAVQTHGNQYTNHGNVVITNNVMTQIGDRAIRFNNIGVGTRITITGNDGYYGESATAECGEQWVKATSMPQSTYNNLVVSGNNWHNFLAAVWGI